MRAGPIARYNGVSQLLHWATAILVFYAFSRAGNNSTPDRAGRKRIPCSKF